MDDAVDSLHALTVTYLGKVSKEKLGEEETVELFNLMEAVNALENIGDVIETNLVGLGLQRIEQGVEVSPATTKILTEFHGAVRRALDVSLQAATQRSERAAIGRPSNEAGGPRPRRRGAQAPGRASGRRRARPHRRLHARDRRAPESAADLLLHPPHGEDGAQVHARQREPVVGRQRIRGFLSCDIELATD